MMLNYFFCSFPNVVSEVGDDIKCSCNFKTTRLAKIFDLVLPFHSMLVTPLTFSVASFSSFLMLVMMAALVSFSLLNLSIKVSFSLMSTFRPVA